MKDLLKLSVACMFAGAINAHAQESKNATSESKVKIEDVKGATVAPEEDPDQIITNKKLRADMGSKSKYSIKTAINYSGSTLEKPLDRSRPNITQGSQNTNFATLGGTIAVKRTLSARNSVSLGGGLRWLTPFESKAPVTTKGKQLDKMDLSDPSVTFQRIGKLGPIQSVTMVGPTWITRSDKRDVGHQSSTDLQQIFAYELGSSGVTLGGLFVLSGRTFDKDDAASRSTQYDYGVGAYPFLEYTINDRFNLRTISGVYVYEHSVNEARSLTFAKNTIYQSVGLGISITRDIFLYPNIQFVPEYMRSDRTNVALNTSINLF